jgi:hypothetical protein
MTAVKKPPFLIFTAIIMCLVPVISVANKLLYVDFYIRSWYDIYLLHPPLTWVILALAPIVGVGIYLQKEWAWYSLLFFSAAVSINTFVAFVANPQVYESTLLIQTVIFLGILIYFFRRNILFPYFAKKERGWRSADREKKRSLVTIGGEQFETINISKGGMAISWPNTKHEIGDELDIIVESTKHGKQTKRGKVVRVNQGRRLGIAFIK